MLTIIVKYLKCLIMNEKSQEPRRIIKMVDRRLGDRGTGSNHTFD